MKSTYKYFLIIIIVLFGFNNVYSNETPKESQGVLIKTLGKFSIQSVYLSFLYVSSIEYQIENKTERENEIKLLNGVTKILESSIMALKEVEKNSNLSENDVEILEKIIECNELLLEEIEYLSELIDTNQKNILDKVNKKHRKTWSSIKELIENKEYK